MFLSSKKTRDGLYSYVDLILYFFYSLPSMILGFTDYYIWDKTRERVPYRGTGYRTGDVTPVL